MRNDDSGFENLLEEVVASLLLGENIVLIGPEPTSVQKLLALARNALPESAQVYEMQTRRNGAPLSDSQIADELTRACDLGASYVFADSLSPAHAFQIMASSTNLTLLTSTTVPHIFGVSVIWASELHNQFGDKSGIGSTLLELALASIRRVGVLNSSPAKSQNGSFREKLLVARYNRSKSVVADHGSLLKGWTLDGEACDPGWELDK